MNISHSELTNYELQFEGKRRSLTVLNNLEPIESRKLVIDYCKLHHKGHDLPNVLDISVASVYFWNTEVFGSNQNTSIVVIKEGSNATVINSTFIGNDVQGKKSSIVKISGSSARIENCVFIDNNGYSGGVLYARHSEINIAHSTFTGNKARDSGGAIYSITVAINITNCTFENNWAQHQGGAICSLNNVTCNLNGNTFVSNTAMVYGGAIFGQNDTHFKLNHTQFKSNSAVQMNGDCIALLYSNEISVDNCLFEGSSGQEVAAIYTVYSAHLVIINTNFSKNLGHGIFRVQKKAWLSLKNCRFENNHSKREGCGVFAYDIAHVTIERCHFENNTSPFHGIVMAGNLVHIHFINCVITGNKANFYDLIDVVVSSSLVITSSSFSNNIGGSIISTSRNSTLTITNCSFVDHSLLADPLIDIYYNTQLILRNNSFSNNSQHKAGIVVIKTNSSANISNCMFNKCYASQGGVFYLEENSKVTVENCTFKDNSAGEGSLAYLSDSQATFISITATNGSAKGHGGLIVGYYSKFVLYDSHLSYARGAIGGAIMLQRFSSLAAYNSVFEDNYSVIGGGAIYKYGEGNVSLENCTFRNNTGLLGGSIYIYNSEYLRMSRGFCQVQPNSSCVTFEIDYLFKGHYIHFYTYNCTIQKLNMTVNSRTDKTFLSDIRKYHMITKWTRCIWQETPYASCK